MTTLIKHIFYFYFPASFLNTGNECSDLLDIFSHEYELSSVPAEDERRRFAWIPSTKTQNALENASQMNNILPRDMLTMPGVENVNFVCIYNLCLHL